MRRVLRAGPRTRCAQATCEVEASKEWALEPIKCCIKKEVGISANWSISGSGLAEKLEPRRKLAANHACTFSSFATDHIYICKSVSLIKLCIYCLIWACSMSLHKCVIWWRDCTAWLQFWPDVCTYGARPCSELQSIMVFCQKRWTSPVFLLHWLLGLLTEMHALYQPIRLLSYL